MGQLPESDKNDKCLTHSVNINGPQGRIEEHTLQYRATAVGLVTPEDTA